MQNNLVRGPHKKAGTANNDFFIISWHSKRYKNVVFAVRRAVDGDG